MPWKRRGERPAEDRENMMKGINRREAHEM
jgi:hypothetical protein